jgi:acyl-[acyl-carrier-protein]-phospholipid O-acyltransferase/long-chain-fatty-acid--[acyl-carrier-protein] ligase
MSGESAVIHGSRPLRRLVTVLGRPLLRLLFRLKIEGDFDAFGAERLLVIANHESFLDGPLLGAFLPIDPVYVVHSQVVAHPVFRFLLRMVDHVAVDPANPMAIKSVVKLVESGRPVVIFPEGRITVTGSLMKVYDGPAFVASKTGATLVPVRLDGPARSYFSRLSGRYPLRLFPRVALTILPSTSIPAPEGASADERQRKSGEAMRRLMQHMIFSSQPKHTLYSELLNAISIFGRRRLIVEDMKQVEQSYGEVLRATLALGRLGSRLAAENEAVGVLLPNVISSVALVIGLSAFRRVPAMLNYTAGAEAIQSACIAACVKTIVTSRQFVETAKLEPVIAELKDVRVVYLEDLRGEFGLADKLWLVLWAMRFPRAAGVPSDPHDPAVILFTSGSEGRPKGVVLSHRAILSNIAQVRAVIAFSPEDKVLNALPVFHSFGLTAGTLLPLLTGVQLFMYPSPLHYRAIPEIAYDRSCTVLLGTSTFLGNYARVAHPYDFFRLRYVVAGAEKVSDVVRQAWFEKFGVRILEGYGATETAPVLAANTPMAYRSGTVGQLFPEVEGRVIPVPGIDRGGLLHVRGPNVMSGYLRYENPGVLEPPESELGPGWYNTGDVVEIDADGFVTILGRVKRFAKVAGEMISLEVVERIALAASPLAQHAASSQPDEQRGEAIVLFTTDDALTRERLQEAARTGGHPEIAVPRKIVKMAEFPLLGTGKVDYVKLKVLAAAA